MFLFFFRRLEWEKENEYKMGKAIVSVRDFFFSLQLIEWVAVRCDTEKEREREGEQSGGVEKTFRMENAKHISRNGAAALFDI